MEQRAIIRDDYGNVHFEVIWENGKLFVYNYGSGRFLQEEEKTEFLKQWIESAMDSNRRSVVEYGEEYMEQR